MKELLAKAKAKLVENKELVIRVGSAVAGMAVGAVVAAVIANRQSQPVPLWEEDEEDVTLINNSDE